VRFYESPDVYWELYDLKTDPKEMTNVIENPEYAKVRKELEEELDRLRKELKVPEQDPQESIIGGKKKNPEPKKNP
jgi:hypothetical protein